MIEAVKKRLYFPILNRGLRRNNPITTMVEPAAAVHHQDIGGGVEVFYMVMLWPVIHYTKKFGGACGIV